MNLDSFSHDKSRHSDQRRSQPRLIPTFYYQIANMKAMKIVVLIKISKLKYELEQMVDSPQPFYLKTEKGELHNLLSMSQKKTVSTLTSTKNNLSSKFILYNEREEESFHQNNENEEDQAVNLCGEDTFLYSKMMEILFQLRSNLFPLLEEFYKYLLGHERIKKIKYESLINKIKTEIAKLDAHMNEHSDVYSYENSFLNIIIACQLFMGCKFVFQEKFRKSKYSLFTKYEKVSKKSQFEEIYGKTTMCLKQYVPPEFQIEEEVPPNQQNAKKSQQMIPQDIIKMSQTILPPSNYQTDRNQLLYGYFRSVFSQSEHKKSYFPYFWLMFDCLNCSLIQIVYENQTNSGVQDLNLKLKMLQFELEKYLKINTVDYGIVGIYQHQNDKHYLVRGILCLGSKNFNELKNDMQSSVELREWKICKIDVNDQTQKRQVENIWQNTLQNNNYDGIITCSILYI